MSGGCRGYDGGLRGNLNNGFSFSQDPPAPPIPGHGVTFTPFYRGQTSSSLGPKSFSRFLSVPSLSSCLPPTPVFLLMFVRNVGTAVKRRRRATHFFSQKCWGDEGGGGTGEQLVYKTYAPTPRFPLSVASCSPVRRVSYNTPQCKIIHAPLPRPVLLHLKMKTICNLFKQVRTLFIPPYHFVFANNST